MLAVMGDSDNEIPVSSTISIRDGGRVTADDDEVI